MPARLRADVLALAPIIVASWAIGGLYLSLGPSVAAGVFGLTSHLIGGLVVTLLCGTGAITSFVLRKLPTPRVLTARRHPAHARLGGQRARRRVVERHGWPRSAR